MEAFKRRMYTYADYERLPQHPAYQQIYDLTHKKHLYQSAGVKEYWIVDPLEKTTEVVQNREGEFWMVERKQERGRVTSILLGELSVDLETLCRPIAV